MYRNRSGKADNTWKILLGIVVIGIFFAWQGGYITAPVEDVVSDEVAPRVCIETSTSTLYVRARNNLNTTGEDWANTSVYVLQDTGGGMMDIAGPVSIASNSTYQSVATVSCGYPVKLIGVGGDDLLYSWERSFTPTVSSHYTQLNGKETGDIQWQAYDNTLSAYYISDRSGNPSTGWTDNATVDVYSDGSNTSITVDSGGEFEATIWTKSSSTIQEFGGDGTGYAIVSFDNTDYDEASISFRQDGRPLSTVSANELPGMAYISSDYTDDVYYFKMESGIGNSKTVFDVSLTAQQGSSDESDIYVDFVQKTKYRSITGGFNEGVVDDTSSRNYVITKQSMKFDIA